MQKNEPPTIWDLIGTIEKQQETIDILVIQVKNMQAELKNLSEELT